MTPPGYMTDSTAGTTTACTDGQYRAEWKPYTQASACDVCGDNIASEATEQITQYDATNTGSPIAVRASAAACCEYPRAPTTASVLLAWLCPGLRAVMMHHCALLLCR